MSKAIDMLERKRTDLRAAIDNSKRAAEDLAKSMEFRHVETADLEATLADVEAAINTLRANP